MKSAAALFLFLAGCAARAEPTKPAAAALPPEAFITLHLPFLRDPSATRATVDLALGTPTSSYEEGRIVGYRLLMEPDGFVSVIRTDNYTAKYPAIVEHLEEFHLLLVYDGNRIRTRRLIRVPP